MPQKFLVTTEIFSYQFESAKFLIFDNFLICENSNLIWVIIILKLFLCDQIESPNPYFVVLYLNLGMFPYNSRVRLKKCREIYLC